MGERLRTLLKLVSAGALLAFLALTIALSTPWGRAMLANAVLTEVHDD